MKQSIIQRRLSKRMTGLFALFLLFLLILVERLVQNAISLMMFLILAAVVLLVDCIAVAIFVWNPLRRCEQAFAEEELPLEQRLQRLSSISNEAYNPLGGQLSKLSQEIQKKYTAALADTTTELSVLQSQINPHFLYNTLDSIRGQALYEGAEDIADMTEALGTFFRYSISNRKNIVTLEEELENIQDYFKIQQFRFSNRFRLLIQTAPHVDLEKCCLPKLTLQPIVENSILHGMDGKLRGGTITIRVEQTEELVFITVSDDGIGMGEETLSRLRARIRGTEPTEPSGKHGGLALPNVAHRIRLLFGEQYTLQVMSTPGVGTDVILTLPRGIRGGAV